MNPNFEQAEPHPGFTDQQKGGYQVPSNPLAAPTSLDFQQAHPLGWDQEMWQHNNHAGYGHGNFQQESFDNHPDHQGRPYFQPIPHDVLPYDGTPHGQEEWANEDAQGYFDEQMNGEPEYHNMSSAQHYQSQTTFDGVVQYP